jgi:hypothetical protein
MQIPSLRKFPYPFRAGFTICNDIDEITTADEFILLHEFLNTTKSTPLGEGLDLEIGDSFIPNRIKNYFSYFSGREKDREVIKDFVKAGIIDSIHSYGERTVHRKQVISILEELEKDNCKVKVWIDHSIVPNNLGRFNSKGKGDIKSSPVYHADLTLRYGIRFAWMGRSTGIVGQETPLKVKSFINMLDKEHLIPTCITVLKEIIKIVLGYLGVKPFLIHRGNKLLNVTLLRDGNLIFEFNRLNNHWHRPLPDIHKLGYMIRDKVLEELIRIEGCSILYMHLGFVRENGKLNMPSSAIRSLRNLSKKYREGKIYVTTTYKLLNYCRLLRYMDWSYEILPNGHTNIFIHKIKDPVLGTQFPTAEDLQGITFYVPDSSKASIYVGKKELTCIQRNPKDHTGRESIMIPLTRVNYPYC